MIIAGSRCLAVARPIPLERYAHEYDIWKMRVARVLRAIDACAATFDRPVTQVISGCAQGVDQVGEEWAAANRIPVEPMPADWDMHGRAAGPIRNKAMAQRADALILVWDGQSRGSASMKREAEAAKLEMAVLVLRP